MGVPAFFLHFNLTILVKEIVIMEEKTFVTNLYNEKAKNDSNSRDLANSLNILSKTVFGDINRFIFELLQNADNATSASASNIQLRACQYLVWAILDCLCKCNNVPIWISHVTYPVTPISVRCLAYHFSPGL